MNQMKNCIMLMALLSISLIGMGGAGCQTRLEDPGPYKGDQVLYNADKSIVSGYKILHEFVKWEYTNRAVLPAEVSRVADQVRENAHTWVSSAIALREAYAVSPTPENRDNLTKALDVLQTALSEAGKYMAAHAATRAGP